MNVPEGTPLIICEGPPIEPATGPKVLTRAILLLEATRSTPLETDALSERHALNLTPEWLRDARLNYIGDPLSSTIPMPSRQSS